MGRTLCKKPMKKLAFDIKKSEDILGEAYIQSSNANAHALLNL